MFLLASAIDVFWSLAVNLIGKAFEVLKDSSLKESKSQTIERTFAAGIVILILFPFFPFQVLLHQFQSLQSLYTQSTFSVAFFQRISLPFLHEQHYYNQFP